MRNVKQVKCEHTSCSSVGDHPQQMLFTVEEKEALFFFLD